MVAIFRFEGARPAACADPVLTRALNPKAAGSSGAAPDSRKLPGFAVDHASSGLAHFLQSSFRLHPAAVVMGDTADVGAGQNFPPPALSMMGDIEGPGAGSIDRLA